MTDYDTCNRFYFKVAILDLLIVEVEVTMLALVLSVDRTGPIAMESVSGQMESARN